MKAIGQEHGADSVPMLTLPENVAHCAVSRAPGAQGEAIRCGGRLAAILDLFFDVPHQPSELVGKSVTLLVRARAGTVIDDGQYGRYAGSSICWIERHGRAVEVDDEVVVVTDSVTTARDENDDSALRLKADQGVL
jgi:hypothetical protein